MRIRNDLISTEWTDNTGDKAILLILSRFKWISDKRIRFINQSNLDCIFEIKTNDSSDKRVEARYLELISVAKVDNEFRNLKKLDCPHMMDHPNMLLPNDTIERLIRCNQQYKVGLTHALNTDDKNYKLVTKINKVDYVKAWGGLNQSFEIEQSFTLLNWRIMELITGQSSFSIDSIDTQLKN